MKFQQNQIISVSTSPKNQVWAFQNLHNNDASLYETSGYLPQDSSKTIPQNKEELLTGAQKGYSILTAVLGVLVIGSVVVNIYLGVQVGKRNDVGQLGLNKDSIQWSRGCTDMTYQITLPNIGGKRVVMNVTHWPECYYELTGKVSKTRLLEQLSDNVNSNQVQQGLIPPKVGTQQASNNRIWNNQSHISITAVFI